MKLKAMLVLIVMLCHTQQVYADRTGDRTGACLGALKSDAELQPINDKVGLGGEPTFGMLANENYPTSDEKQVIFKWATKREQCLKDYPPPNDPITQVKLESFNSAQLLILELYKGNVSYGEFVRQRQDVAKIASDKIQEINGQRQQQQQQRCESLRREIASMGTAQQGMFGPTPAEAWQRQRDEDDARAMEYAKLTPEQKGAYGISRGAGQLAGGIAGMMGYEPRQVVEARQRENLIQEKINFYNSSCQ